MSPAGLTSAAALVGGDFVDALVPPELPHAPSIAKTAASAMVPRALRVHIPDPFADRRLRWALPAT
jgi:hypothetical protein